MNGTHNEAGFSFSTTKFLYGDVIFPCDRGTQVSEHTDKFSKIGLTFDKTRKQQEEYRILKEKLEEMKNKNDGKEYMIYRNKVMLKSEVTVLARKAKESAGTAWASDAPVGGNPGADKGAGRQSAGQE